MVLERESSVQLRKRMKGLKNDPDAEDTSKIQSTASPSLSKTIGIADLEEWQNDNEFILTGYRRAQYSWRTTFGSVFEYLHNETVNIHSHLWPAVAFFFMAVTLDISFTSRYKSAKRSDLVFMTLYLLSAVFCHGASALFHTIRCHSQKIDARSNALDYAGIIVLVVGSYTPSVHFGFPCSVKLQITYCVIIVLLGLGGSFVVWDPEYAKPTHRVIRTIIFCALGSSGWIPLIHLVIVHGFEETLIHMGQGGLVIASLTYVTGAFLYAIRVPERLYPGKFDYFFSSHQFLHFCVVAGASIHYAGLYKAMQFSLTQSCH